MSYATFLEGKRPVVGASGRQVNATEINAVLFPFQRDLVRWSVRKGRSALFVDTGLGKTLMQVEWARLISKKALIIAPLSVAQQTVRMAADLLDVEVAYARQQADATGQLTITNYEMFDRFDPAAFDAVVLDESSILKALDGKTRQKLTDAFKQTPYKLCCTATPAPNDITEIANHAEFLGVMSRAEMLASFFVHDGDEAARSGWRLKGHAEEPFYRWLASWGMSVRKPSDLGYDDDGFILPELTIEPCWVEADWKPDGQLFHMGLHGIQERHAVRKATLESRINAAVELVGLSWHKTDQATTAYAISPTEKLYSPESEKDENSAPQKRPNSGGHITPNGTHETEHENARISDSISSFDTALQRRRTPPFSPRKTDDVLFADANLLLREDSTLTTITERAESAESSAIDATKHSDASATAPPNSGELAAMPKPPTSKRPWILWAGLNEEQDRLAAAFGDKCVSIDGRTPNDEKERLLRLWLDGQRPVLISKARVLGFGLNLQRASNMAFVGLSDSWEAYYQCIRRSWRFGQEKPVRVHIVLSTAEEDIYHNVMRKEEEAAQMREKLIEHVAEYEREEIEGESDGWQYETAERQGEGWRMLLGDSCERLAELDSESIDLSVFSPPFLSLFTYSPTERDVGNSRTEEEFYAHFGLIIEQLLRVTKPGRIACCHVQQVASMLLNDGVIGVKDFRGGCIRAFEAQGWIYHGEVCIDKNPQAQAIRTHSKGLLFNQHRKDSTWSRPALADYVILFRKPGENRVPVQPETTNDEWIEWAHPIWYGIRESATLNAAEGREDRDEKHVAALQLETIERCIRLWSNKGETVLSPFGGIGSEGYVAVKQGRQYIGIELKRSYFEAACKNLGRAEESITRRLL